MLFINYLILMINKYLHINQQIKSLSIFHESLRYAFYASYKLFSKAFEAKFINHFLFAFIKFFICLNNKLHFLRPLLSSSINQITALTIIAHRLLRAATVICYDRNITIHGLARNNSKMLICRSIENTFCIS